MIRARHIAVGLFAVATVVATAGAALAAQPGPDYLVVTDWSAQPRGQNGLTLSAVTDGQIPRSADAFIGSELIVGLAWADLDTGTAVVATIHPVLGRDSNQRPDSWHVHTVQLAGGATAPNDFCLVEVSTTPEAGIRLVGSSITLQLAAAEAPMGVDAVDAAVGFTVHGDDACATNLGVRLRI